MIFYSNGYEHWIWDDARYPPRPVQGFYNKDELELLIQRRASRKPLGRSDDQRRRSSSATTRPRHPPDRRGLRAASTQRKALLVMATGAGKTRTVIALATC